MQDLRPKVNLRECPTVKCDSCGHVNKGHNPFEEEEKTLIND